MNLTADQLTQLAEDAERAAGLTTLAMDRFRLEKPEAVARALYDLSIVQGKLNAIYHRLVIAGADNVRRERTRQMIRDRRDPSLPPLEDDGDVPLHLLSSEKAVAYAEAIAIAAKACREMETERGIEDGIAERLEIYAEIAEFETFGPKGLEGE